MAQNYISSGDRLDVVLAGTYSAGDILVMGNICGVLLNSGVSGDTVTIATEGVFLLKKKAALAITAGDLVYWDDTNNEVTKTASGNYLLGIAVAAQGGSDTTVKVSIYPKLS